ncbi:MAG: hypothetical protein ACHQ49_02235 [Elusimicrobiota bacterium]
MIKRFAALAAAVALLACAHAPAQTRYQGLEMRLVSEIGGRPFPLWDEPGTMALDPEALFSGKDFAAIEASGAGGDDKKTPSLWLHFTPEAAQRFTRTTTESAGRRLAVVVDGKVVTAPKILHPITTGLFEITGPTESYISEMYRSIETGSVRP